MSAAEEAIRRSKQPGHWPDGSRVVPDDAPRVSAPADPRLVAKVPFSLVDAFLRALGVESVSDVVRLAIDADGVTITTQRRDPDGKLFAAGNHVAVTVTMIGFEPRPKAAS